MFFSSYFNKKESYRKKNIRLYTNRDAVGISPNLMVWGNRHLFSSTVYYYGRKRSSLQTCYPRSIQASPPLSPVGFPTEQASLLPVPSLLLTQPNTADSYNLPLKKRVHKTKTEEKTPSTQRFRIEKMKELQKAEST